MSVPRILIVYSTTHGQSAKVARYVAAVLTASGHAVAVADARALPPGLTPRDFDGVIVGSSVTVGRHQRSAVAFVRAHRDALNAKPSAFFSLSGAAAARTEDERARAELYVSQFLGQTGWRPRLTATVAGAIAYTKYNPFVRWILKRITAKTGGPTDTTRDHEFTDWAQVEGFAQGFAAMLARPAVTPEPAAV